jgi:hypothetical protein
MAWEAISGNSTFATFMGAEKGFITMAMHRMSFALVAEKTGR